MHSKAHSHRPDFPTAMPSAILGTFGTLAGLAGLSVRVLGADPVPVAPPAPPAPTTAGWVNDWLRQQTSAFSAFDIGGQFRTRFEYRDHVGLTGVAGSVDFRDHGADVNNTFWLFRSRLHLGVSATDWARIYVEGHDNFTLGDDRRPNPESDRLDLHQAYLQLGSTNAFPLTARVGRQELSYGDERLVGAFDWNNVGRVFDAAKLRYESAGFWVDGFAGRVVLVDDNNFNVANDYDWFSGLYLSSKAWFPIQETQFYFLARNTGSGSPTALGTGLPALLNGPSPRDIYTVGTRVRSLPGRLGPWDYSLEAAGQFGRYQESVAAPVQDQRAYATHAAGGYRFVNAAGKPRLGIEYNFSSGDSNPHDGTHETFDNLFPTNHRFYGYMDFFSWQNVHNPRVTASLKPWAPLTLTLDGHAFWLADTHDNFYTVSGGKRPAAAGPGMGYGINPGYGSYVGSEVDFIASWAIHPSTSAQVGYGHWFVGDYVKSSLQNPAYGSSDADFIFVQLALTF